MTLGGSTTIFVNDRTRIGRMIHWSFAFGNTLTGTASNSLVITPPANLRAKAGSGGASGVGPLTCLVVQSGNNWIPCLAAFSEDGLTITVTKTPDAAVFTVGGANLFLRLNGLYPAAS